MCDDLVIVEIASGVFVSEYILNRKIIAMICKKVLCVMIFLSLVVYYRIPKDTKSILSWFGNILSLANMR